MLSIVVPVYKEENSIDLFMKRMQKVLYQIGCDYEIIFCLDPSPDKTLEVIEKYTDSDKRVKLMQFSRRFGQPAATYAGIMECKGDICVVIDVDLQDPPELIVEMIAKWKEGYDVVYARRTNRKGGTIIYKMLSAIGYKTINKLSEVKIPVNTGDYRLINRRVMEALRSLNEHHGYLRGLVASVGFNQCAVEFKREERRADEGKYNKITGSLKIGLNGLICYSVKPLEILTVVGFFAVVIAAALVIWSVIQAGILKAGMPLGLTVTDILIIVFGSMNLACFSLLGEYIGRIYDEAKNRPMYIVDKKINMD